MIAFLNRPRTGALCLGLAGGYLIAGWWPFAPLPRNRVEWLRGGPGLSFQPPGIAYEAHPMPWNVGSEAAGFTIELCLEAGLEPRSNIHHILTIHDGDLPSRLVLCQWKSELLLRIPEPRNPRGFREAGIDVLLRQPRVIAVTCGAAGTTFFADGRPIARYPRFVVPTDALRGGLILGDAANGKHAWTGKIFGLAILNCALDAAGVARRHLAWTTRDATVLAREPAPTALYFFDEGSGSHASDRASANHRIEIPSRYHVPQKTMLEVSRDLGVLVRSDLRDTVVNLLGFVPFGFLVFHYRRLSRPHRALAAAGFAVFAGGTLSLIIEVGQAWLPTRVSSATDLILNTVGTMLGIVVAVWARP